MKEDKLETGRKYLPTAYRTKDPYLVYTKNSQNPTGKRDNSSRKQAKDMRKHSTKEKRQVASEHMERCSVSLAIREDMVRLCSSELPEGSSLGKTILESWCERAKESYGERGMSFQMRRQIKYK